MILRDEMENIETTVAPTEAGEVLPAEQVNAEAPQAQETLDQPADEQTTDEESKAVKALQKRLNKRTADYYREKARADQAERQRQQPAEEHDPQDVRRLIEQEAERLATAKERAKRIDAIERDLRKSVADYEEFYADLSANGPAAAALLESVAELDEAPKVLAHLANNREELYSVLELSGTKQAIALARIAARLEAQPPKVSTAPKPVKPVGAKASPTGLDDSLPLDEWMRRRNAQDKR